MKAHLLFDCLAPTVSVPFGEIEYLTEDSRKANENTLFVCIRGAISDGHQYAASAYEKGCRVFVAEKEIKLPKDALVIITDNTRAALAKISATFFGNPAEKLTVIVSFAPQKTPYISENSA